jgi:MT0933-like antitoxin protein
MGLMDKAKDMVGRHKDTASDAVDQHSDSIDQHLDTGTAAVDERTGGRHTEHLEGGADRVRDGLDSLDGNPDDDFGGTRR